MINVNIIKRNHDQKLEIFGLPKADKEKQDLRLLLLHLCIFLDMYKLLRPTMAYEVACWINKLCPDFGIKILLKEGKKRKRKEKSFPTPLSYKEIENPKEVQKTREITRVSEKDFERIQLAWYEELKPFMKENGGKYDNDTIDSFFLYWADRVAGTDKMLWQTKRSWSTKLRLAKWTKTCYQIEDQTAAIRLVTGGLSPCDTGYATVASPPAEPPERVRTCSTEFAA